MKPSIKILLVLVNWVITIPVCLTIGVSISNIGTVLGIELGAGVLLGIFIGLNKST